MMVGRRRLTASRPLTKPSSPPKAIPASAASQGLMPATISMAVMTAVKLNIQPTDRSISQNRQQEDHAERDHALKGRVAEDRQQVDRVEEARPGHATMTISAISATMTPISSGTRNPRRGAVVEGVSLCEVVVFAIRVTFARAASWSVRPSLESGPAGRL